MPCTSVYYIICERSGSSGVREGLEEKVAIFCTYGHLGPGRGDPEGVQLAALGVTSGVFSRVSSGGGGKRLARNRTTSTISRWT
jgi:hypothetical protein